MDIVSLLYGASVIAITVATPFVLNSLAGDDILFTKVKEGTAKAIMRGQSLADIVMSNGKSYLNDPSEPWYIESIPEWEVLPQDKWRAEIAASPYVGDHESRGLLARKVGIFPVGIPPFMNVHKYRFVWSEGGTGNAPFRERDEITDFIFVVEFPYTVTLIEAENKDRIPMDVRFQLSLQIVNPAKALFTENWLDVAIAAAIRSARSYVGQRTIDELKSENDPEEEKINDLFSAPIKALSDLLPDDESPEDQTAERKAQLKQVNGLSGRIGAIVISANIQTLAVAGSLKDEILAATVAEYTAEQKRKATVAEAAGRAEAEVLVGTAQSSVIRMRGEAEAGAITARLAAYSSSDMGALLAQCDAMGKETLGKTVIWANNPIVSKNPDAAAFFDALRFTPEQLAALLKTVMPRKEGVVP